MSHDAPHMTSKGLRFKETVKPNPKYKVKMLCQHVCDNGMTFFKINNSYEYTMPCVSCKVSTDDYICWCRNRQCPKCFKNDAVIPHRSTTRYISLHIVVAAVFCGDIGYCGGGVVCADCDNCDVSGDGDDDDSTPANTIFRFVGI